MANNQLVATYGFKILGAEAASAVPELQQVLRGGDERAEIAAEALIYIGHPPAPSLEDILTDADMSVRKAGTNAMWAMTNDVRARF
jgi:hypothetical protein